MSETPQLEAQCPWCGPVTVGPADLRCELHPRGELQGLCEFPCPRCSRLILTPVPPAGVETLHLLGAGRPPGPVPFELLERHAGPPISSDEIIDLHVALDRLCCPQVELTQGSSR